MVITAENLDFTEEFANLEHMWNQYSHSTLAGYLKRDWLNAQAFLTKKLILDFLASRNGGVNFFLEDGFIRPVVGAYPKLRKKKRLFRLIRWLVRPVVCRCLELAGSIRAKRLTGRRLPKISFLDVGCGSGNYYRYFLINGLHHFLDYLGIDIAGRNIDNCQIFYPEAKFEVGNLLEMRFPDRSFDIVFASHIFEHLDPKALPRALSEVLRVAGKMVIIHFFNEKNIPDHVVNKVENYHWNCLSRQKLLELVSLDSRRVTVIDKYLGFARGRKMSPNGYPISRSTMIINKA